MIADMHFDHLGLVCADLAQGRAFMQSAFGVGKWSQTYDTASQLVTVQFGYDTAGLCYELVCPNAENSPVSAALKAKTNMINHIAYCTPDLEKAAESLRELGCAPLGPASPAPAFNGAKIQFFYTSMHFIAELIEGESAVHGIRA